VKHANTFIQDPVYVRGGTLVDPVNQKAIGRRGLKIMESRTTAQGMKAAQKTICSRSGLQPLRERWHE